MEEAARKFERFKKYLDVFSRRYGLELQFEYAVKLKVAPLSLFLEHFREYSEASVEEISERLLKKVATPESYANLGGHAGLLQRVSLEDYNLLGRYIDYFVKLLEFQS